MHYRKIYFLMNHIQQLKENLLGRTGKKCHNLDDSRI